MVDISKCIAQNGFPASVFTKSALILRDLDTWKQVNDARRFVLFVSMTVTDDRIRRIFEPNAAPVDDRLDVLRQFKSAGIPAVPHRIYRNQMPVYDEVFVLLSTMKEIYHHRGVNVRPLEMAMDRYCDWLGAEKKKFNRRKSLDRDYVDNKLVDACHSGRLRHVLQNEKRYVFLQKIILDRQVLDYTTLRLA